MPWSFRSRNYSKICPNHDWQGSYIGIPTKNPRMIQHPHTVGEEKHAPVVYPIIYKVLAPSQVVVWDFFHQQYEWHPMSMAYGFQRCILRKPQSMRGTYVATWLPGIRNNRFFSMGCLVKAPTSLVYLHITSLVDVFEIGISFHFSRKFFRESDLNMPNKTHKNLQVGY